MMDGKNAYKSLAAVYDIFTADVDYKKRTEYVDGIFRQLNVRGTVLDAGCGTGSLSVLLREKGYEMVCADASAEMLAAASNKFFEAGYSDVTLLAQRLQDLDLYGTITGCVSMLDVVNHLPEKELKKAFARIALFSEKGAPFIFDFNLPYKHRVILAGNSYKYSGRGYEILRDNVLQTDPDRIEQTLYIYRKGFLNRELIAEENITEYTYAIRTVIDLLESTGFKMGTVIDGETYETLTDKSQRALITCFRV